jgi:multidrug transporter EmrE-like cation transporter
MDLQFFLGIFYILLGAALINLGIILQKRQIKLIELRNKETNTNQNTMKDPIWILGILMQTLISFPFLLLGMDILGIAVAQPIANGGIIFLALGSKYILHDEFKKTEVYAIVLLIVCMIILGFGNVSAAMSIGAFIDSSKPRLLSLILLILTILSILLYIISIKAQKFKFFGLGLLCGIFNGIVSISIQLFTMAVTEISVAGAILWLILGIIGLILFTVFSVIITQFAFKKGKAMHFIASAQITMNIIPVIAGIVLFSQIVYNYEFFLIGLVGIIVSGVFLNRFQTES